MGKFTVRTQAELDKRHPYIEPRPDARSREDQRKAEEAAQDNRLTRGNSDW